MSDLPGRLVAIDDDEPFVRALAARICGLAEVVVHRNACGAAEYPSWCGVDVVLLSMRVLAGGVLNTVREIRASDHRTVVIVRSHTPRGVEAVLLFEAGADDYVGASDDLTLVEARVCRALCRRRACACCQSRQRASEIRTLAPDTNFPEELGMTRTEERLWRMLRQARGELVTMECLAEALWKRSDIDSKVIYEHVSRLRARLVERGWTIENQRAIGYRLVRCDSRLKPRLGHSSA